MTHMGDGAIRISKTHPALAGHFPGNPVIPGVVLLSEIIAALERRQGGRVRVKGMPSVKFLAVLHPDAVATISFTPIRPGLIKFECHAGDALIAAGQVELDVLAVEAGS